MGYTKRELQPTGDNDDSLSTTEFVQQELDVVKTWPFLQVRQTSGQVVGTATITVVNFNTITYDTDSGYSGASDTYTIPETGIYDIKASCGWIVAAGGVQGEYKLMIYINGSRAMTEYVDTSASKETIPIGMSVGGHWRLTSGSTVNVRVYQNTGSNRTMEATALTTNFSIRKVGEV